MASKSEAREVSIPLNGQFGFQQVVLRHSDDAELGRGSYGSVVKAKLDDLPCAAKILHRNFFNSNDPAARDFATRFEQECQILRDLKHPCIVQFLGVVQDPNSGQLVLLMEMMKESLTSFLEQSTTRLPYHLQINISHDIALAVAHLHRNGILHRDLSSNNVLLTPGCQAKVTDFGMSRLADANPSMTRSRATQCPGTLVYMPPEALLPIPSYSEKLDTFSMGVLMIQIITRKFPNPSSAQVTREDPTSPIGQIIVPVSEVERRRGDMNHIPTGHPLLPIARSCLKDRYQKRPDATQICQSLAALKVTPAYEESATTNPILSSAVSPTRVTSTSSVDQITNQMQSLPSKVAGNPQMREADLHKAAERGDVQTVQRLLTTTNINSKNKNGKTALILAAEIGHFDVVQLLVNAQALIDLPDKIGRTPLYYASWNCHISIVRLLIQYKAGVNICDEDGFSPVYVASQDGHTDIVDLLVNAGGDIHLATTKTGDVPLVIAAQNGHTQTVQRLLELGANINHQNKDGGTPLYYASMEGHISIVRLLIQYKAGVNICIEDGFSPVYLASQNGHTDIVDLLVNAGGDIHLATIKTGDVPLVIAAHNGHTQTVQRLLELGANINHQNKYGRTPLFYASWEGHSETVELLLRNGAKDIPDKNGCTPLLYASWNGHSETVELLLRNGAKDIPTKFGNTALSMARDNNHREVIRLLQRYQN